MNPTRTNDEIPRHAAASNGKVLLVWLCLGLSACDEEFWFGEVPSVRATVLTPSGRQRGDVPVRYILTSSGEPTSVYVIDKYTADEDSGAKNPQWRLASPSTGTVTTNLMATGSGRSYTFVWNSSKDLEDKLEPAVRIRITPVDREPGSPAVTGPFEVDNRVSRQPAEGGNEPAQSLLGAR